MVWGSNDRSVLVLVGPTASGKTAVGIALAQRLGGEIISADARQVYRFMDIGTAKPTPEERESVPHHCIDALTPDQVFNAAEFGAAGRTIIDEIFARLRLPIVVGGSGLYIRSLIDGLFEGPGADPEFRDATESRLRLGGTEALLEELRRVDPVSAERIDHTKPRRLIRALEVFHATGTPLSALHRTPRPPLSFVPCIFGLLRDRKELYTRINERCRRIVEDGLLTEVADLQRRGYSSSLNALNTVGYREAYACLRGEIDVAEMLRLFQQNSRRYAKRQLTWFRADPRVQWVHVAAADTPDRLAAEIERRFLEAHGSR
ncbi:MAG: tRNA (adenosine(37)-N6)-dimethylallyltransferase MiaA [Bacteroidota bacterium]